MSDEDDDDEYHYYSDSEDEVENDYTYRIKSYVDMLDQIQTSYGQVLWHSNDEDHRTLASTTVNPMTIEEFVEKIFEDATMCLYEERVIMRACALMESAVKEFKKHGGFYDGLNSMLTSCQDYANEIRKQTNDEKEKRRKENELKRKENELKNKENELKRKREDIRAARLKRFEKKMYVKLKF